MKFCPQCGTAFEPTARFCLECGFDKSTVEPVETGPSPVPGEVVSEHENIPVTPIEVALPPAVKPGCPQCGTTLDSGERFCAECGFDTSTLGAAEVAQPKQLWVDDEIPLPEIPVAEPVLSSADKQFCPFCGSGIGVGERFCPQCGYNITPGTSGRNQNFNPVDQPEAKIIQPPIFAQQKEPVIIPPAEPIRYQAPANVPPTRTTAPPNQQIRKKTWLWIALILIGLGVIGVAGWFGYTNYSRSKNDIVADTISNMVLPPVSDLDTSAIQTEIAEETATEPEKSKTTAKPLSKIDQELARQKAKEPKKSVPQSTPPAQKTNPEQNEKEPVTAVKENLVKVILEVGRKEEPKSKNPKGPTKLLIQKPTMIVRIITDHYNNGMGTPHGGIIKITDRNGQLIGSYKAMGKTGKNNTPSSKWVVEPNIKLEKGTYFIEDSDQATWSKNFVGTGFVIVEGYEVK